MSFGEQKNYYDILEINPRSSPQEIRAAYIRLKSAYSKDSPALYSLYTKEETDGLIAQVCEAYAILSSPDKRRDYDQTHLDLNLQDPFGSKSSNIVSIDRTPPMDASATDMDILVTQTTDFTGVAESDFSSFGADPIEQLQPKEEKPEKSLPLSTYTYIPPENETQKPSSPLANFTSSSDSVGVNMNDEIIHETEWRGEFIRRVREFRRISLDEISESSKISKRYLTAIEEENFALLPAAVFLRGFLIQLAKKLRIPAESLTQGYLLRYRQACPQKN